MTDRRTAARYAKWLEGRPGDYLLDSNQQGWVERFRQGTGPAVWCIGRQVGKSYAFFVLALETMLKTPGAVVRYCAKTKDSAWSIAGPNLELILRDCPEELKPKANPKRGDELVMPHNGATLTIFGTDAQSFDKGRGPFTHLIGLDECGFFQDLEGVEAALLPSLQTTDGQALYLSTPSDTPAHPYSQRVAAARASGRFETATIYQNPRVNVESIIRSECERLGLSREQLLQSTYWRREYLAEWVTEESRAALPAWNAELHKRVVKEWPKPQYFHSYVAVDYGGHEGDPHAALFGYVDFRAGKLIIEEEFERHGGTITELVFAWKETERRLWGVDGWDGTLEGAREWSLANGELPPYLALARQPPTRRAPFLRVGDHNDPLQAELAQQHRYTILSTPKRDKHLAVDGTNTLLAAERIIIHPRCRRLVEQCYSTLWDQKRSRWERTPKDHGDLIDTLIYMARNVVWNRDPNPPVAVVQWQPPQPNPLSEMSGVARRTRRY